MKTFWLSFADNKRNRGAIITDAEDERAAVERVNRLGINPGGEVMIFDMTQAPGGPIVALNEINRWRKDSLITPAELDAANYRHLKDLPPDEREAAENHPAVRVVCEDCNR